MGSSDAWCWPLDLEMLPYTEQLLAHSKSLFKLMQPQWMVLRGHTGRRVEHGRVQKLGDRQGWILLHTLGGTSLVDTLILDLASRTVRVSSIVLAHIVCNTLLQQLQVSICIQLNIGSANLFSWLPPPSWCCAYLPSKLGCLFKKK